MPHIRQEQPFPLGYTAITERQGQHRDMLMDFGILRLAQTSSQAASMREYSSEAGLERAFLLIQGELSFHWQQGEDAGVFHCARSNPLEQEPYVLHVGHSTHVRMEALSDEVEIAIQGCENPRDFPVTFWQPGSYRSELFGEGTLQDTSTRRVRTIFDAATAPESAMVMGEVINYPGKWSSYPPHTHAQPEIYHYRFYPEQGFGFSEQGDNVYKVHHRDTVTIPSHVTHPQTAAPGYAMYYIWLIPHLPDDRFGPDSRIFRPEHAWTNDAQAPIWPDAAVDSLLRE